MPKRTRWIALAAAWTFAILATTGCFPEDNVQRAILIEPFVQRVAFGEELRLDLRLVNLRTGGATTWNATYGTIEGTANGATYTAPAEPFDDAGQIPREVISATYELSVYQSYSTSLSFELDDTLSRPTSDFGPRS